MSSGHSAPPVGSGLKDSKEVWYFAYGSNLNEKIFHGRRGCRPLDTKRAILEGYRLLFNLRAAPFIEPAMANVEKITTRQPGDFGSVHGIAYLVSRADWYQIFKTEGGGRYGGYQPTHVQLKTYEGETIEGITLVSDFWFKQNQPPSLRYWTLITEGAAAIKLDDEYLDWLKKLPHVDRREMKKKHFFLWLCAMVFMFVFLPPLGILIVLPSFGFRMLLYKVPLPAALKEAIAFPMDIYNHVLMFVVWFGYDLFMKLVPEANRKSANLEPW